MAGTVGTAFQGIYGTLTLQANGAYTYGVDNNNPVVDALDPGDFLVESFNYTVLDHIAGLSDTAVLDIKILGSNDAPVAKDDNGSALEAGGVANGTAGSIGSGNVLSNDTDVDFGDTPSSNGSVTAIRTGATEGSGAAGSSDGAGGFLLTGTYGTLTIHANGTYTYVVNNANAVVDALSPGETLSEAFNYTVSDRGGLSDIGKLTITINGANDAPIAVNDIGTAVEKGGTRNGTGGSNATGNVLLNDTDVDNRDKPLATQGSVTAIRLGDREGAGLAGTVGAALKGLYGSLILNSDGSFTYVVDNDNATVEALNPLDTVSEDFNYTLRDSGGLTDTAVLAIAIHGANDAPVASDDSGTALEAGGVANGTAGSNASGNVLTNDTDVDSNDTPVFNGAVTSVRTGSSEGTGVAGVADGFGNFVIKGTYGTLTINANGTYTYAVDNSNPTVDALSPGDSLQEAFNYTVLDHPAGLTDIGVLRITIQGANDAPIARNDRGTATEAGGTNNGTPGTNPSGNVLTNDSDVDRNDTPLPTKGSVTGIRTGTKEGAGVAGTPDGSGGFLLVGTYGTLRINADGSYTYSVDNTNPVVDGMDTGDQLTDTFNYTVLDHPGGLSDIALLTITIKGANDAPVANNDSGTAIEAGGTFNTTPGADASGNVLTNDSDVDGSDTPSVNGTITAIRLGATEGTGSAGVVGSPLQGLYGSLSIDANGNYRYAIDNANPTVEALNEGDSLIESFNYTVSDSGNLSDTAVLAITILGTNDAPVATDDSGIAKEAGGIKNSTGGFNATGNVLANDTDVDSKDTPSVNGKVTAFRTGGVEGIGTAGTVGTALKGLYGDLMINADGTYTYAVDNSNLTVERLNVGDQLAESFNYTVLDHLGGLTDIAVLTIAIEGTNDHPLANDDFIGRLTSGQPGTIRVIANDTDIDSQLVPATIQIVGTAAPGDPLVIPGQGTWSVNPSNGDITFTPEAGFVTNPSPIQYTVQDEQGATSNPASVTMAYDPEPIGPEPMIPVTDPHPVNLYLLLDNSTSMLGNDPSGVTRLEAQNRLAFYYSLMPAFNNAGYIFEKDGVYGFNGGLRLTTNQILSDEIKTWNLIDNPFDNVMAQKVTVHTIDFSYLVTHTKTTFDLDPTTPSPDSGVILASEVLTTTTPDQLYSSSTSVDWISRGLPAPNSLDAYTAPGTPGNRYSGTEMLGALTALKDLLNQELDTLTPDTLTYVDLITDGRPERRPWWDNRPEYGQGWSGVNVALPTDAELAGDPITSSGLRYTSAGTPIKVPNAAGVDVWGANQQQLNTALNATAAQSDPGNVGVAAFGLGDGGVSNWSAIYSDLFGNQTFQSNGTWSYKTFTSTTLPSLSMI